MISVHLLVGEDVAVSVGLIACELLAVVARWVSLGARRRADAAGDGKAEASAVTPAGLAVDSAYKKTIVKCRNYTVLLTIWEVEGRMHVVWRH
jgi:hypothetical protein